MSGTTLLLDPATWDLMVDAYGNIAMARGSYALAQDAASAIKLFQAELWYDVNQGIPYWQQILGYYPPISLMKAKFVAAALTVPGVVSAQCFISNITLRQVNGQVQIKDANGVLGVASF
jgi:hypothetical protein